MGCNKMENTDLRLHEGELNVMELLWSNKSLAAKDIAKIINFAQEENIDSIVTTEKDAVKLIDMIRDVELPVSFYALKLKAFVDVKDVCGL